MHTEEIVLHLIGLIYDAAIDSRRWSDFLDALASALNGHVVNLSYLDANNGPLSFFATARTDPSFLSEYESHYGTIDPWLHAARARNMLDLGFVDLGESVIPPSVLRRGEFYNDYARRHEYRGGMTAAFPTDGSTVALSVGQRRFGQFGEHELQLLRVLVPHVRRAIEIHQRLAGAQVAATNTASTLDLVPSAILLVSSSGRVVFSNRTAELMLRDRDGLLVDHGALRACTPGHTSRLRSAIADALQARGRLVSTDGFLLLPRPSGRRPYSVLVAPLMGGTPIVGLEAAAAAVFVNDPESISTPDVEMLRLMLGLTPGEARLVHSLVEGHSLNETAERLSIQVDTARKRLKTVFQKTDTHRQAELVRIALQCGTSATIVDPKR